VLKYLRRCRLFDVCTSEVTVLRAGRGFINVESLSDLMKLLGLVTVPE